MAYLSLQQYTEIVNPYPRDLIHILKERHVKERAKKPSTLRISDRRSILNINGVSLPDDLLIEILSLLPVETLLRCKSVSKSWCKIIVSPLFTSHHLQNYYDNNHDMDCLLTTVLGLGGTSFFVRFFNESLGIYAKSDLKPPLEYFKISGPCNGIYYVSDGHNNFLWNPTINDIKFLPKVFIEPSLPGFLMYRCFETSGFGYDPLTNDYKVVVFKECVAKYSSPRIDELDFYEYGQAVFVYTLRTDSLTYWGDLPQIYRLIGNKTHIFLHGCLYWVRKLSKYNFEVIVSFNIVTNELKEIQMPNYGKSTSNCLGINGDSLAFYDVRDEYLTVLIFDKRCWTKKFTVNLIRRGMLPIGHLKNNMILLKVG